MAPATPERARLRQVLRSAPVLTVADQIVSSGSNFALSVLVARAGGATALGAFSVAYLIWITAAGMNCALLTDPMTVEGDQHGDHDALRKGMAATLLHGTAWAALLTAVGGGGFLLGLDGAPMLALAAWTPFLLLQTYWRASAFRLHRPALALINDIVFTATQAVAVAAVFALDAATVPTLIASWGLGGAVSAGLGLRMFDVHPSPRGGLTQLRRLWPQSRWFCAEFGTGFFSDQCYLLILPALLGTAGFGIYRAGYNLVGPVIVIFLASSSVGLPQSVRHFRSYGARGLSRYTWRFSLVVIGASTTYCTLVAVFARPLLLLIYGPQFATAAIVTQIVAVQFAIISLGTGCNLALKTAGRVRTVWLVRLAAAVISIAGVLILVPALGLVGAALSGVLTALIFSGGLIMAFCRLRGLSIDYSNVVVPNLDDAQSKPASVDRTIAPGSVQR